MTQETDERFMRVAIEKTKEGVAAGQLPFGACLVRDGEVIASAHNTVPREQDITRHAEIDVIREACKAVGSTDLSGSVLYATATPCAMCFTAAEIAGVERIVFGVGPDEFRPLFPSTSRPPTFRTQIGEMDNGVSVVGGVLREECLALFQHWAGR